LDSEQDVRAQLLVLRDLFRMSGIVHEAQRLQLQLLPRVVIAHSVKSEAMIKFTPEKPDAERYVRIKVQVKGKEPKNLSTALKHLDEWVKFIVGSDFEVRIEYGDKKYVGKAKPYGRIEAGST
jgi:hypothetical protein